MTAGAVSAEAGLAHGTFYRYFRNKEDAFRALAARWRESFALERGALAAAPASRAEARAALRRWIELIVRAFTNDRGVVRAWYDLAARDPAFAAERRERRDAHVALLAHYLEMLVERGYSEVAPDATARTLSAMLDGFHRRALGEDEYDESHIRAAVEFVERGVFGALSDDVTPSAARVPEG